MIGGSGDILFKVNSNFVYRAAVAKKRTQEFFCESSISECLSENLETYRLRKGHEFGLKLFFGFFS